MVWQRGQRLDRVPQHIEAGARRHHLGHAARVVWIDDAHHRPQRAVGDARLGVHLDVIEDRDAGRLAAGAGCGRDGDQRLAAGQALACLADRRIDIGQEVGGIGGIQVGGLGGIDAGTTADRHVAVEGAIGRELDRLVEGGIGRLDAGAIEQYRVQPLGPQRFERDPDRIAVSQVRIGHDHDPRCPESFHLEPDFAGSAQTIFDAGRVHGEDRFRPHVLLSPLCCNHVGPV